MQSSGAVCRCSVDQASQGYSSSSSSNRAATLFQRRRSARPTGDAPAAPAARVLPVPEGRVPTAAALKHLERVPPGTPPPLARVHLSVSRLYAEIVLLPDLQPQEDPTDALKARRRLWPLAPLVPAVSAHRRGLPGYREPHRRPP